MSLATALDVDVAALTNGSGPSHAADASNAEANGQPNLSHSSNDLSESPRGVVEGVDEGKRSASCVGVVKRRGARGPAR